QSVLEKQGWQKAVVKPRISATSFRTWVTSPEHAGNQQSAFDELLAASGAVVQRFVDEVQTRGEWSLMFFGGKYSHAVLKQPKAGDFRVQEEYGGSAELASPRMSLIEQAGRITDLFDDKLLYARVDGVEIDGRFCLMELELIEPLLFLSCDSLAPQRFA